MTQRTQLVKICGLRESGHSIIAAEAGADMLGMIFAPARRQITPQVAAEITDSVRARFERPPGFVGVFVEPSVDELLLTIETAGLDFVQIHGRMDAAGLRSALPIPAIPAFAFKPGGDVEAFEREVKQQRITLGSPWVHLDTFDPVQHGGSGKTGDWSVARQIAVTQPVMLAGGLNPENVAAAIETVRPLGVDVSSGVERNGVKQNDLIRSFIASAREAFAKHG